MLICKLLVVPPDLPDDAVFPRANWTLCIVLLDTPSEVKRETSQYLAPLRNSRDTFSLTFDDSYDCT